MSVGPKWIRIGVAAIAGFAALLNASSMSSAEGLREIRVEVSQAKLVDLDARAATVFVADPAIADVQTPTSTQVIVYGKTPGRTTIVATGEGRRVIANLSVIVDYPIADMMRTIRSQVPGADVRLQSTPTGVVGTGSVPDLMSGQIIAGVVSRYLNKGDTFINNTRVQSLVQVALAIRIAEVSRAAMQNLGVRWGALVEDGSFAVGLASGAGRGDVYNANAVLDALVRDGSATILAEPTLTAISGDEARFLSGGEFPVPVMRETASGEVATAVEFKTFGVSLDFTPTVLSPERISLRVKPAVSALSDANSVKIDGARVPGITIRTAEATIEVAAGQTLAIAGLFQDATISNAHALPGLSDIPVLGALFRSDRFRRRETEMVVLVTPYLARGVDDRAVQSAPVVGMRRANDVEDRSRGRKEIAAPEKRRRLPPRTEHSPAGEAGFVVE